MSNIKVAVRVRPFLTAKGGTSVVEPTDPHVTVVDPRTGTTKPAGPLKFTFDHVYDGETAQDTVYDDLGRPLLEKAMRGFIGTLFAYGQTGSGKSHSMFGSKDQPGVIPRLCNDLFSRIAEHDSEDAFEVSVSYFQVYNEAVYDLLEFSKTPVKVGLDPDHKEFFVAHAKSVVVNSAKMILNLIAQGDKGRIVAEHRLNAHSSRSHAMVTVKIRRFDKEGKVSMGQLNLVDLAGSERAKRTGTEGKTFKEGTYINKSLTFLLQCFDALRLNSAAKGKAKKKPVPFNNSTLTKLLKRGLGGDSLSVMLANVAPAAADYIETANTCKIARRVKDVKTAPKRHVAVSAENAEMQKKIREKQAEIDRYNKLLAKLDKGTAEYESIAKQLAEAQQALQRMKDQLGKQIEMEKKKFQAMQLENERLVQQLEQARLKMTLKELLQAVAAKARPLDAALADRIVDYEEKIHDLRAALVRLKAVLATEQDVVLRIAAVKDKDEPERPAMEAVKDRVHEVHSNATQYAKTSQEYQELLTGLVADLESSIATGSAVEDEGTKEAWVQLVGEMQLVLERLTGDFPGERREFSQPAIRTALADALLTFARAAQVDVDALSKLDVDAAVACGDPLPDDDVKTVRAPPVPEYLADLVALLAARLESLINQASSEIKAKDDRIVDLQGQILKLESQLSQLTEETSTAAAEKDNELQLLRGHLQALAARAVSLCSDVEEEHGSLRAILSEEEDEEDDEDDDDEDEDEDEDEEEEEGDDDEEEEQEEEEQEEQEGQQPKPRHPSLKDASAMRESQYLDDDDLPAAAKDQGDNDDAKEADSEEHEEEEAAEDQEEEQEGGEEEELPEIDLENGPIESYTAIDRVYGMFNEVARKVSVLGRKEPLFQKLIRAMKQRLADKEEEVESLEEQLKQVAAERDEQLQQKTDEYQALLEQFAERERERDEKDKGNARLTQVLNKCHANLQTVNEAVPHAVGEGTDGVLEVVLPGLIEEGVKRIALAVGESRDAAAEAKAALEAEKLRAQQLEQDLATAKETLWAREQQLQNVQSLCAEMKKGVTTMSKSLQVGGAEGTGTDAAPEDDFNAEQTRTELQQLTARVLEVQAQKEAAEKALAGTLDAFVGLDEVVPGLDLAAKRPPAEQVVSELATFVKVSVVSTGAMFEKLQLARTDLEKLNERVAQTAESFVKMAETIEIADLPASQLEVFLRLEMIADKVVQRFRALQDELVARGEKVNLPNAVAEPSGEDAPASAGQPAADINEPHIVNPDSDELTLQERKSRLLVLIAENKVLLQATSAAHNPIPVRILADNLSKLVAAHGSMKVLVEGIEIPLPAVDQGCCGGGCVVS